MTDINLNKAQSSQLSFREEPSSQLELQNLVSARQGRLQSKDIQSCTTVETEHQTVPSKCLRRSVFVCLIIVSLSLLALTGFIQIAQSEEQQIDSVEHIDSYRINLNPLVHKQISPFSLPVYCRVTSFSQWNSSRLSSFKTNLYRFDKLPYSKLTLLQELNASFPAQHYEGMAMYIKEHPINSSIYVHSAPLYLILLLGAFTPNPVNIVISQTNPLRKLIQTNYILNNLQHRLIFQASESRQRLKESELLVTSSPDWAFLQLGRRIIYAVERQASKFDGVMFQKLESIPPCSRLKSTIYKQKYLKPGLYLISIEN